MQVSPWRSEVHTRTWSPALRLTPHRTPAAPHHPGEHDREWAQQAASAVAERFTTSFRPQLRPIFLQPFLETVLAMLGKEMAMGLRFSQSCLLNPPPDPSAPAARDAG